MRRPTFLLAAFSAFLPVASLASGDDPIPTPWGELRSFVGEHGGSYSAPVRRRPDDGRLTMPVDIEPIGMAGYFDRAQRKFVTLPLEFDPESGALTAILPEGAGQTEGFGILLQAAKTVSQDAKGDIDFPAQAARIVGETAKLESNGSHHRVGFWTNPDDYVAWDYTATRWGRYRVWLTYSTEAPDGGIAEITMGGAKLDVELPSTESWYRYETIDAGNLYLATDGKHELIVRARKLSGAALMNLKAVFLQPTFESDERPTQADDGSVTLHARDAKVSGVKLRYEPKPEKNTLGYWTNAFDDAQWRFDVTKPGTFDVEVSQGCGTGQGGTTMELYGGGWSPNLQFVVEETGHFQNFVPRIVGRVTIPEAGEASLTVRPHQRILHAAACDIRQIRLIPVDEKP